MEIDLEITRVALAAAKAKVAEDVVAARVEVVEEEFWADFFQGYSNLKRRVALVHFEWDLTAFSSVESDFWEVKTPARKDEETGATATEGAGETQAADASTKETVVVVDDAPLA